MDFELKNKMGHEFFLIKDENGIDLGKIFFHVSEGLLTIEHTEVEPEAAGKGIGKLLVKRVVEYAREKKFRVLVLCPFARKVFDRTPEFHDVLSASVRPK